MGDNTVLTGKTSWICRRNQKIHDKGIEIAIVIGGGNILEGLLEPVMEWTVQRGTTGMLATVINGMALQGP
jgi:uridylate kinase